MAQFEILYQRAPSWLVGETTPQRDARMRSPREVSPAERYPGNHAGRVTSVRPLEDVESGQLPSLRHMADKDRPCVVLDLDEETRQGAASKTFKVAGDRLVPVTFADRFGAVAVKLRERCANPEAWERDDHAEREAAMARHDELSRAHMKAVEEYTALCAAFGREAVKAMRTPGAELPECPTRPAPPTRVMIPESAFDKAVADLTAALPETVTHSGTGLYATKVTPAHADDAQAGAVITNHILRSDDFAHASWNKTSGGTGSVPVVTANDANAPQGDGRVCRVDLDKGAGDTLIDVSWLYQYLSGFANPHDASISVWMKSADENTYSVAINEGQIGVLAGAQVVSVTPTWQRFTLTNLGVVGTAEYPQIGLTGTLGCSATASIYIWRAELSTTGAAHPSPGLYSGAAATSGVILTSGGLGALDAYRGGYITNATEGETRAIIEQGDGIVALAGDLTNWTDTDDLDIYDAWSTVQAAADQTWTDQGADSYTATQELRLYAGTYTQAVIVNAGMKPTAEYRLLIRANTGDSVTLTNSGLGAGDDTLTASSRHVTLRDLAIVSAVDDGATYAIKLGLGHECIRCTFSGGGDIMYSPSGWFYACDFGNRSSNSRYHMELCVYSQFEKCTFGVGMLAPRQTPPTSFRGCTFSDTTIKYLGYQNYEVPRVPTDWLNCTFYSVTSLGQASGTTSPFAARVRNCIFHSCGYAFDSNAGAARIESDHNTFYNCTKIARVAGVEYTTLADWQAADITTLEGDTTANPDANSLSSDPLLTDPASGDFSLGAASPCRSAGGGSGVVTGINGVAFDPHHPDIGAWSSGMREDLSAPTFSVANDETGTSFTATVDVEHESDIARIQYRRAEETVFDEATRTGDGDKQVTGLTPGLYDVWLYAENADGDYSAPAAPQQILVRAAMGFYEALASSVRARFKTQIADSQSLATQYDNDGGFEKPNDALWCRWNVLFGESRQVSTGASKRFRATGVAIAQIFVPMSDGESAVWPIVDAINLAFRSVTVSGVRYLTPSLEKTGRRGAEFQVNVTCPFEMDDTD